MSGAERDEAVGVVAIGALRLRTSECGGAGRPLVLVNGLGAPLESWRPLRASLDGHVRTVAIDAPGVGGSETPPYFLTMRGLARVLLRALDRMGHTEVDVLGYSFGGAVAQEMARLAPDRVGRLVLAATSCGWGAPLGEPLALAAAAVVGAQSMQWNPLGYGAQLMAISTWSSYWWMSEIRQPTLVLAGTQDRVAPVAASRVLADGLANAELALVEGDHWFLLDADADAGAGAAARVVREFLARDHPSAVDGWRLACT